MSPDVDPILADVEAIIASGRLSATAFGVRALNDPALVHELRRGREVKRLTRRRIAAFIDDLKAVPAQVPA